METRSLRGMAEGTEGWMGEQMEEHTHRQGSFLSSPSAMSGDNYKGA